MKRKVLVELFLYIIIVVIGVILLLSQKPRDTPIQINTDFEVVEQRGDVNGSVPMQ